MSLSDKDLLTGSNQCEPRWKDDFEKSVSLFFFTRCVLAVIYPFLLVLISHSSLWSILIFGLFTEANKAVYSLQGCDRFIQKWAQPHTLRFIHTYIHLLDTDHGPSNLDLICVCVCVFRCVNNEWGSQTLSESRPHSGSCYRRPPSE